MFRGLISDIGGRSCCQSALLSNYTLYAYTLYIAYFSSLMRSNMVFTSDFNFPFITTTPFSMCFVLDVETTHSKRILYFFELFSLMNGTIEIFRIVSVNLF